MTALLYTYGARARARPRERPEMHLPPCGRLVRTPRDWHAPHAWGSGPSPPRVVERRRLSCSARTDHVSLALTLQCRCSHAAVALWALAPGRSLTVAVTLIQSHHAHVPTPRNREAPNQVYPSPTSPLAGHVGRRHSWRRAGDRDVYASGVTRHSPRPELASARLRPPEGPLLIVASCAPSCD